MQKSLHNWLILKSPWIGYKHVSSPLKYCMWYNVHDQLQNIQNGKLHERKYCMSSIYSIHGMSIGGICDISFLVHDILGH